MRNIEQGAFWGIGGLESISIPAGVTNLGKDVFWHCDNLEKVAMRGEKPNAPDDVFSDCPNLKEIHVPANAKSWAGMTEWQGKPLVFDARAENAK